MGLGGLLGRLCMAFLFINSGLEKFHHPEQATELLISRYEVVYQHLVNKIQLTGIPPQLKPSFINQHAAEIIIGLAGLEIIGGVLLILNNMFGAFLLFLFVQGTITIIHNPWIFNKTREEEILGSIQALKDLAILGGLILVGYKGTTKSEVVQSKPEKKTKTLDSAPTQSKGKNQDKKEKIKKQ